MKRTTINRMSLAIRKKLTEFFSEYPEKVFESGQKIINGDQEKNSHVYFVEKGYVRLFYESEHGEDIMIHIFKEYSYFPMALILAGQKNIFTFEALSTVQVRVAPREAVLSFIKHEPDVLYELTSRLSSGLMYLSEAMCHMFFVSAQKRIINFLSIYARRFGIENGEAWVTIPFVLRHKEIADSIGLTRETVTREMKKLEREGKVKKKGHFYSINMALGKGEAVSKA